VFSFLYDEKGYKKGYLENASGYNALENFSADFSGLLIPRNSDSKKNLWKILENLKK